MIITDAQVIKLAKLARIAVRADEVNFFCSELNNIIGWIQQLQKVDITGVEPLTSVSDAPLALRKDVVADGDIADLVLHNAHHKYGYFVVPKMVE